MMLFTRIFSRSLAGAFALALISSSAFTTTSFAGFEWVPASETGSERMIQEEPIAVEDESDAQILIPMGQAKEMNDVEAVHVQEPRVEPEENHTNFDHAGMYQETEDRTANEDPGFLETFLSKDTPEETAWEDKQVDSSKFEKKQPKPRKTSTDHASAEPKSYDVIEGFGSDMPLALAMRQVVPAQYSFAFASGVNAGDRVSWSGGKPWNLVLQEMVAPVGLYPQIIGGTVQLQKGHMPASAVEASHGYEDEPIDLVDQSPVERRTNIKDPGPVSQPISRRTEASSYDNDIYSDDDLSKLPDLPTIENSRMTPLESEVDLLPMEPPESLRPNQSQGRMRMTEQIERETRQENIELRMRAEESKSWSDNSPAHYQPDNRPYDIDPYSPSNYMNDATVSEKNAYVGNENRFGNSLSLDRDRIWEARRGDDLKETLVQWARSSNINLVWNARNSYALSSNIMVSGDFRDALRTVMDDGLPGSKRPKIKLVDTPSGSNSTTFVVSDRS